MIKHLAVDPEDTIFVQDQLGWIAGAGASTRGKARDNRLGANE